MVSLYCMAAHASKVAVSALLLNEHNNLVNLAQCDILGERLPWHFMLLQLLCYLIVRHSIHTAKTGTTTSAVMPLFQRILAAPNVADAVAVLACLLANVAATASHCFLTRLNRVKMLSFVASPSC